MSLKQNGRRLWVRVSSPLTLGRVSIPVPFIYGPRGLTVKLYTSTCGGYVCDYILFLTSFEILFYQCSGKIFTYMGNFLQYEQQDTPEIDVLPESSGFMSIFSGFMGSWNHFCTSQFRLTEQYLLQTNLPLLLVDLLTPSEVGVSLS